MKKNLKKKVFTWLIKTVGYSVLLLATLVTGRYIGSGRQTNLYSHHRQKTSRLKFYPRTETGPWTKVKSKVKKIIHNPVVGTPIQPRVGIPNAVGNESHVDIPPRLDNLPKVFLAVLVGVDVVVAIEAPRDQAEPENKKQNSKN